MNVHQILQDLRGVQALVVGDICLDRWCYYDPQLSDPSRETGIPRVAVVHTENTPGAGGTIANNLAALGVSSVSLLGCMGDDGYGQELLRALAVRNIGPELMLRCPGTKTFVYTKLINRETGEEDRPRVDFVNTESITPDVEQLIINTLDQHFSQFDVILVSDQAETEKGGVITPAVRDHINKIAAANPDKIVWVDSRMRPEHFRHVILKPNRDEADAACRRAFGSPDYRRLFENGDLRQLIVTHGDAGAQIISQGAEEWVPGRRVKAIDICGAGDSFSAGAACALSVTGSPADAVRFGNLVASITVTKKGTGTASPEELIAAAAEWQV